jgi:hypothetical protein
MSESAKTSTAAIYSSNSYGDTVTISQEGLEAYKQLSVENSQGYYKSLEDFKKTDYFTKDIKEKRTYWYDSLHRNIDKKDNANTNIFVGICSMPDNEINKLNSIKWRESIEGIDKRIAEILDENGITLTKDETLNFSIDQNGKIKIGNGINGDKKTKLEKIFNEDNNFRTDLINSHNLLQSSQPGIFGLVSTGNSRKVSSDYYDASWDPSYDHILRTYGLTPYDFELTTDEEKDAGALAIKFKDGTKNDELLMKMFTEDAEAFNAIENDLEFIKEFCPNGPTKFEYSFSYKNGVTIEKGQDNQESLNKKYNYLFNVPTLNIKGDKTVAAITISPSGEIIDSQIIDQFLKTNGTDADKAKVTEENLNAFIQKTTNNYMNKNDTQHYQTWLQQYVFEIQRLTIFNTGANQEEIKNKNLTISRTFSNESIKSR